MRLLYRQGNYGSICFPYKESCDFASKECLRECSEQFNDMTLFRAILKEFETRSAVELYKEIQAGMIDNDFELLSWFDCGDCPKRLQRKVVDIMTALDCYQIGFTRSKSLWSAVKDLDRVRFILTVERGTKIALVTAPG